MKKEVMKGKEIKEKVRKKQITKEEEAKAINDSSSYQQHGSPEASRSKIGNRYILVVLASKISLQSQLQSP